MEGENEGGIPMKKTLKRILLALVLLIVAAAAGFGGLYATRIQSVNSIEKLTDYADGYNLYRMDVK